MNRLLDPFVSAGGRRPGLLPLVAVLALVTLLPATAAFAQEGDDDAMMAKSDPVLDVLRSDWDTVSGKLVSLGEAIPAEKYSWAPSDEVRSVAEVLVHVAGPNFALTGPLLGDEAPADNPLESLGENPTKEQILDVLKQSIDRVDEALAHVTADDLGKRLPGVRPGDERHARDRHPDHPLPRAPGPAHRLRPLERRRAALEPLRVGLRDTAEERPPSGADIGESVPRHREGSRDRGRGGKLRSIAPGR